jgi:hypothetical protein
MNQISGSKFTFNHERPKSQAHMRLTQSKIQPNLLVSQKQLQVTPKTISNISGNNVHINTDKLKEFIE